VLLSQQSSQQLQQNHHQISAHPEPVQTLNKRKTKLETKQMLCSLRSLPLFSQLITYFNLDSSSGMPRPHQLSGHPPLAEAGLTPLVETAASRRHYPDKQDIPSDQGKRA